MCSLSVFGILSYCIHWITDVLNFPLLLPLQSTTATSNYNNYIAFFQTEQQSFCAQAQNIFFHEFFAFFLFLSAIFFYRPPPSSLLFQVALLFCSVFFGSLWFAVVINHRLLFAVNWKIGAHNERARLLYVVCV